MGKGLIIIIAALALSGCVTASGSFCAVASPIRPSAAEIAALSDTQVEAILVHNTQGQKLCGWKP